LAHALTLISMSAWRPARPRAGRAVLD